MTPAPLHGIKILEVGHMLAGPYATMLLADLTHDGFWRSFAAEAGIAGFATMAERVARRAEVLTVVTKALAADTAASWEARLRPAGVPAAAVRTLPEALDATPDAIVTAGRYRLVGSPVRITGYRPEYLSPPGLGEHST
jgi:CoA:oxalate CoA-transferase